MYCTVYSIVLFYVEFKPDKIWNAVELLLYFRNSMEVLWKRSILWIFTMFLLNFHVIMLIFVLKTLALIKRKLTGLVSTSPGTLGRYIQQKTESSQNWRKTYHKFLVFQSRNGTRLKICFYNSASGCISNPFSGFLKKSWCPNPLLVK